MRRHSTPSSAIPRHPTVNCVTSASENESKLEFYLAPVYGGKLFCRHAIPARESCDSAIAPQRPNGELLPEEEAIVFLSLVVLLSKRLDGRQFVS